MPVPPKLVRRLVIAPLVVAVEVVLIGLAPVLLVLAVLVSPFTGGHRPVRFVLIVLSFALHHLVAMLACLGLWIASGFGATMGSERMQRAHYALMRWFVSGIHDAALRLAHVAVELREDGAAREVLLAHDRPLVVLGRHAGEGDTLLVMRDLLVRYGRGPRVVLHHKLRLDPLIDVLGDRLPNRFVDPRGGDTERDIAEMAAELEPRGALVIFPEGVNFSAQAQQRAIERLERQGFTERAQSARRLRHLSPPRPGGTLAAIDAGDVDVVIMGHVGFPTGLRETWDLLPHPQSIEVRVWLVPGSEIPRGRDEQIRWLDGCWHELDDWIEEREAARRQSL